MLVVNRPLLNPNLESQSQTTSHHFRFYFRFSGRSVSCSILFPVLQEICFLFYSVSGSPGDVSGSLSGLFLVLWEVCFRFSSLSSCLRGLFPVLFCFRFSKRSVSGSILFPVLSRICFRLNPTDLNRMIRTYIVESAGVLMHTYCTVSRSVDVAVTFGGFPTDCTTSYYLFLIRTENRQIANECTVEPVLRFISTKSKRIFTARKESLRRLCFHRCLSVHGGSASLPMRYNGIVNERTICILLECILVLCRFSM